MSWRPINKNTKDGEMLVCGGMWNGEINGLSTYSIAHVNKQGSRYEVLNTDAYSAYIEDPIYYIPAPKPVKE